MSRSEVFVQIVLPIAILVVSSAVTLWPSISESRKSLRYEVVAVTPLGPTQAMGFADLKLMKGDKAIDRPYLATIRFITGGKAIEQSDFASPVIIKSAIKPGFVFFGKFGVQDFPMGKSDDDKFKGVASPVFVDARVAARSPDNLPIAISLSPSEASIAPLLLNSGDEFLIELLVNGGPPVLTAEARIAGIKELERIVQTSNKIKLLQGSLSVFFSATLLFFMFLMLFTWWKVRKYGHSAVTPFDHPAWWFIGVVVMMLSSAALMGIGTKELNIEKNYAAVGSLIVGIWIFSALAALFVSAKVSLARKRSEGA